MPTNGQLRTIHKAARAVGLNEPAYRTLLRNTGKVETSKDLTNAGVEDVMAVLEEMGFNGHEAGPTYWRDKVATRGASANERMLHRIKELAVDSRYPLPSLCGMFSSYRTDTPENLTPREAWKLIEMLKQSGARDSRRKPVMEEQGALFLPF